MTPGEELPRAIVRRIVKNKMMEVATSRFGDEKTSRELPIHKDAVVAFCESAKIFIHCLSAAASEICRDAERQTINAEDILKAVEDIDFVEFVEPLKAYLEGHRHDHELKKAARISRKKRKGEGAEELQDDENGENGHADDVDNQEEEEEDEE